ncbi:MAG: sodium:solute symporter family protein [Planctomycetes bacterium]|nr:sodium:solute symporter family protein [Planctomycetota bacterium]MBL7043666.1 sodium:solute symporter family protein [Pirellulaceae bacterium]
MPPGAADALRETNFTTIDWVIVIAYPLISLGIGLYVARFIRNMNDFVVAGHRLGVCLGIATMTGTELGLITVMYNAQKGFTGGFAAFHIALAAGLVTFVVGVTGFLVYRLREMQVLTIPEFYERRFDRKTRILGGIMMAFGGILNMGLFLKVGSMFIVGITGLSAESWAPPDVVISAVDAIGLSVESWPLAAVMVFLITLVLAYTCLGGMVSVVIADYVQFVVLSLGLLLTSFLAVESLGWTNIFDSVDKHMVVVDSVDKQPVKSGFDPTIAEGDFGWEYIIWMGFVGLVSCGIWPTSVARALAMDSPNAVKRQYMFGSISYLIRFLIPCFWGICAYVFIMQDESLKQLFFPSGYPPPESLPEGVEAMDNLYAMPVFLGRILPVGIIGIISAGMIAAFMSTHDSYLLCWSSVLTQDVVAPICKSFGRDLKPKTRITLSRVFIVLVGLYVLYWGLLYKGEDDIWDYMAVTGAIYFTGAFALLLGGLYWKGASSGGAFLALLVGSMAVLGLSPVQDFLGIEIASAWVGLTSIGATLAAMIVGSICFPDRRTSTTWLARWITIACLVLGCCFVWVAVLDAWECLWMVVLIGGVGLFAVLAIVVTFGGFFDVVKLIKSLREGGESDSPQEPQDQSR